MEKTSKDSLVEFIRENSEINDEFIDDMIDALIDPDSFIGYDEANKWTKFKKKQTIKNILENDKYDFEVDKDYRIEPYKPETGRPGENIYMTIETIKCICMMSPTEDGQKFRRYYIAMEKLYKQYVAMHIQEKLKHPIPEIEKRDFDINQYRGKEVLYLIRVVDDVYKYGITTNICKRLTDHRRTLNYDRVIACWDCINRSVSSKVEENIKKYCLINKLGITYQTQTEIIKTDDISPLKKVFDIYVNKYANEWNDKFIDARLKQELEVAEAQIKVCDRMNEVYQKISGSWLEQMFYNPLGNKTEGYRESLVKKRDECKQEIERKEAHIEEVEDPDIELLKGKAHCKRCGHIKELDQEFEIDEKTGEYYKQCNICHDTCRVSDKIRYDAGKKTKKEVNYSENDLFDSLQVKEEESLAKNLEVEKKQKLQEKECHKIMNTKDPELINTKILERKSFCKVCSREKSNTEFQINPKTGIPFKQCQECRELRRSKDKRFINKPTKEESPKEKSSDREAQRKYEAKKRAERIKKTQEAHLLAQTEPQKTLSEKHKEYYAQKKLDIIDHKKKMREKNKQDNTDPTTQFCSKCSQRRSLENFSTNPRTQALYKQCDKCRAY